MGYLDNAGLAHFWGRIKNYIDNEYRDIWISPEMTSNNAPNPYAVSASSVDLSSGGQAFSAFDGKSHTLWHSAYKTDSSPWLMIDFGDTKTIYGIRLIPRTGYPEQLPISFTLQGSLDGENWVDIAQYTNYPSDYRYIFGAVNFRYYRLYNMQSNYRPFPSAVAIADIYFLVSTKSKYVTTEELEASLAGKQNTIAAGAGLIKDGDTLSVDIPVHRVLLQAEYDALMDEQKRRGLFFIREEAGAAENVSYAGEVIDGDEAAEIEPPDGEEDVDAEGVVIVDRIVINGERIGLNAANIEGLPAESGFPSGGIIIWSGASDAVPSGWVLCDGTNGTPDLRDRFVVGAGSTYAVGAKGGEAAHKLTINEIPNHDHGLRGYTFSAALYNSNQNDLPVYINDDNPPRDCLTGMEGGFDAHNNLPPYYALCYIMKL